MMFSYSDSHLQVTEFKHKKNGFSFELLTAFTNTSESFREPKVQAFLHPIYKDKATKLYSLPLAVGTAFSRDFVIDFNGAAPLLLNCATAVKSTSYHSIRCDSTRCKFANPNTSCPKNITNNKPTCRKYVSTSLSARPVHARLLRDTLDLSYTPEGVFVMDTGKISTLTLTCTDDATALKPIPKAFGGYIGFGNNHLSIPSQLVPMYKLPPKMSLCLPSTEGMESYPGGLWIGGGPFYYLPYLKDVSKIFASTPLIGNNKGEYLIDVKSIEIGGKTIPILHGPTKICTLAPYTVLQSSIYKALVTAFVGSVKMAKAPTAKPFSACFHSDGGRGVPVIDLVMSGGAKWMIHGSNSLVKVSKDVVCLGFVDGGVNPKNPILIGGFQMEDNLMQFDLKASKFSFSSSLLLHNTSCSIARLFGM